MAASPQFSPGRSGARPSPPSSFGLPSQIDFRQILIVLRAHSLVAVSIAVVCCTLLVWQQMRRPKLYSARSYLVVDAGGERVLDTKPIMENSFETDLQIETQLEQMKSEEVVHGVVASLTPAEQDLLIAPYLKDSGNDGEPIDRTARLDAIVRSSVVAEREPKTMLISVTATNRDPRGAALLANRFPDQFIRYLIERNSEGNDSALTFLREQADNLKQSIETSERDLQAYRQRYNLVSLEDTQNIVVDRLKLLNSRATEAHLDRLAVEDRLHQAESVLSGSSDIAQLASIAEFSALTDVQQKIDDLLAQRAVLAERYGLRHPKMQENARAIEALERLRADQVQAALVNLRNQRDKAVTEESELASQLAAAEQESLRLDRLGVDYNVLRRELDTKKATYTQILTRLNEATISAQLQSVKIHVAERAHTPSAPFSPNPRKALLEAIALAAIILVGYPFTVELFFARVRNWSDVEQHLGSNLLGEIGALNRLIKESERPHLVEREQDETVNEQFRAIYSQLLLVSKIDPPKTVVITSTVPGEGKSFIASNLAAAFVAHGRKVLLIDADLRRPSQHRNYGLENKAGTLRWLEEGGTLTEGFEKDDRLGIVEIYNGLHLLRTGGNSRKASELMESGRLADLIEALQRKYDIVIVDTPPAGVFPDTLAFAKVAHEIIFICRFNSVARQQVRAVLDRLRKTGLDVPGVVLNALPAGRGGAYHYHGYGYYHAQYSRYYGEKKKD